MLVFRGKPLIDWVLSAIQSDKKIQNSTLLRARIRLKLRSTAEHGL